MGEEVLINPFEDDIKKLPAQWRLNAERLSNVLDQAISTETQQMYCGKLHFPIDLMGRVGDTFICHKGPGQPRSSGILRLLSKP